MSDDYRRIGTFAEYKAYSDNRIANNLPYEQSFSGADISVMFIMGGLQLRSLDSRKPFKHASDIQTITISSTTSVLPIRSLGNKRPIAFTRGARTFAGSMIFTVIDKDPFQEIFAMAADASSPADGSWHIDEMPPFDILINAANESGKSGMQLISGVTLSNYGTTYSVDDIFTEITYTYMAEHVSPFVQSVFYDDFLKAARRKWMTTVKTPDEFNNNAIDKSSTSVKGGRIFDSNSPLTLDYEKNQYLQNQFNQFVSSKNPGTVFTAGSSPGGFSSNGYDSYSIDHVLKTLNSINNGNTYVHKH
jgi:hypothetical protein